ncbi:zinc finger protein 271-like [Sabethes cyaneus]|uniref:zinc finger protein 271-like n=1 Tax=Sabethes cyaneus TaxID=53552 RepID=UPI00237DC7C2|nr:zinc finger protein 271-like [Sabethes cyaneus]
MNVCRTCLDESDSELVPVFSKLEGEFIANIIVNCSSISIVEDDGLPAFVCSACLACIKQILEFAKKARESDLKLRNVVKPDPLVAEHKEPAGEAVWFDVLVTNIKTESENEADNCKPSNEEESNPSNGEDFDNDNDSDWKDSDGNGSNGGGLAKRSVRGKGKTVKSTRETNQERRQVCDKDVNDDDEDVVDDVLDAKEREVLELVTIEPGRHICCLCSYDFESREKLEDHGKKNHVKKRRISRTHKPFFCAVCYKRYCTREALQVHLNLAAELINRNIYRCKLCPARFWSSKRRRQHAHNHPKYSLIDGTDRDVEKKVEATKRRSVSVNDDDSDENNSDEDELSLANVIRKVNKRKHDRTRRSSRTVQETSGQKSRYRQIEKQVVDEDDNDDDEDMIDEVLDEKEQEMMELISVDSARYICCLCSYDFQTRDELEAHGKKNHEKKKRVSRANKQFFCKVCYKRYCSQEALEAHQNLASGLINRKIYSCKFCSARFWSSKRRRHHAHNHPKYSLMDEPEEEKKKRRPTCCNKGCYDEFETEEELIEHGRKLHALKKRTVIDPALPYECPVCFKCFETKKSLTRHRLRSVRPDTAQCSICGKEFKFRKSLEHHERQHRNERPFPCEQCGKRFGSKQQLKWHYLVHKEDKPFVCTVCGWSFKREGNLQFHMLTHSDALPFKCDVCQKSFKGKYHLQYHMRTHTGHKPWHCRYCEKSFADHANRARHEISHTGIKPYKCTYCEKSFIRRRCQIEHESTHTGIKPYRCELCNRTFSQKPALKRHLEMHPLALENQISLAQPSPMPADAPAVRSPAPLPPVQSQYSHIATTTTELMAPPRDYGIQ